MFSITVRVPAGPSLPAMGAPWDKHLHAPTPGQYIGQVFSQSLAQYFTNTDEDAAGPEQRLFVYPDERERCTDALSHGDGGLCKLRPFVSSEVSCGSADPGTASLATGTKAGHSSPSHSSRQHSCLVIWLGEIQIYSELPKDTCC